MKITIHGLQITSKLQNTKRNKSLSSRAQSRDLKMVDPSIRPTDSLRMTFGHLFRASNLEFRNLKRDCNFYE